MRVGRLRRREAKMAQGFRAKSEQLPGTGSGRKRRQGLVRGAVGILSAVGIAGSAMVVAATAPAGAAGPSTPSITNFPRQALSPRFAIHETWAASNWSGYAETGIYTGVSATWSVPTVTASTSATYSSAWIGVDGFNNSDLIQTGTEEDYYSGAAHYNAWWGEPPRLRDRAADVVPNRRRRPDERFDL
jgi:hypothetical protein